MDACSETRGSMVLGPDYQAGTNVNEGEVSLRMKYRQLSGGRAGVALQAG